MNREIKFRAWDIFKKVFIPTDKWAVVTCDFKATAIMIKDWEDYQVGEYMFPNTQSLMQFTGLHDKNGKEIYEGDIIRSDFGTKEPIAVCFGEYHDHTGKDDNSTNVGFYFNEYKNESSFGKSVNGNTDCYEIIGNIYENPELLK